MATLMNSLKAISISRKKLSILLFLMFLPALLWAEPFRAAIVTDSQPYQSILEDTLRLLSGEVTSPQSIALYEDKREERQRLEKEKAVSEARQAERAYAENETQVESTSLLLEVVTLSLSDAEKDFLYQNDEDAVRFIKLRDDIDLLLVADASEDGMLTEATLYSNGEELRSTLFITEETDEEFLEVAGLLKPIVKDDSVSLVKADLPSSVSIAIDGESVVPVRGYLALEDGEHLISYAAPGYMTKEIEMETYEGAEITTALEPSGTIRLFVSPRPYDAAIYLNGLKLDTHSVPEAPLPFQLTATREGFRTYAVQSRLALDRIEVMLYPGWMDDVDIVEKAKDRFYSNLLSTIVSFGCYVASGALEDIYPQAGLSPATGLFMGISFVGLVELFDSMFDYFQMARAGI